MQSSPTVPTGASVTSVRLALPHASAWQIDVPHSDVGLSPNLDLGRGLDIGRILKQRRLARCKRGNGCLSGHDHRDLANDAIEIAADRHGHRSAIESPSLEATVLSTGENEPLPRGNAKSRRQVR